MKGLKQNKLKDWFSITGIRISNFIKEHKYVSLVIGIFLLSAVIALAVRAADTEISNAGDFQITSFTAKVEDGSSDNTTEVPNFSPVTYTITYHLGASGCGDNTELLDDTKIVVTLKDDYSYAKWYSVTEDANYSIDGKTLNIEANSESMCTTHTHSFTLYVLNADKGKNIEISSISFKPGSNAETSELLNSSDSTKAVTIPKLTTTYTTKIDSLSVEAIPGIAIKNTTTGNRDGKFGLALGFYSSSNLSDLTGLYVDDKSDIYMYATKTEGSSVTDLGLSDSSSDYGIYNDEVSSKHYFSSLPVLSSSGKLSEISKVQLSTNTDSIKAPVFSLVSDAVEYEAGTAVKATTIKIDDVEKACTRANGCTFSFDNTQTSVGETYYASYTLTNGSNSTTLYQKITFVETEEEESTDPDEENTTSDITVSYTESMQELKSDTVEYDNGKIIVNNTTYTSCDDYTNCSAATTTESGVKVTTYTIKNSSNTEEIKISVQSEEYYKISVSELILNGELETMNINNKKFYVLGTYYVTAPTENKSSIIDLYAFTNSQSQPKSSASNAKINVSEVSTGTNTLSNAIYVEEQESLVEVTNDSKNGLSGDYYTAAMGEKVEIDTKYHYGADADENISDISILVGIDSNYLQPSAYVEDTNVNTPYYSISFKTFGNKIGIDPSQYVTIMYCTSETSCDINPATYYESPDVNITHIKVTIASASSFLKPGTEIDLRTRYTVKTIADTTNLQNLRFNSTAKVNHASSSQNVNKTASSKYVYLTPYKLRTNIYLGRGDELNKTDITLDASKNDVYTFSAMTTVTSPVMLLNSNVFGYDEIPSITLKFKLPKNVNYIYNGEYEIQPNDNNGIVHNSDGTTTLTYTYNGVEPNEWIESIYFDFNVDVTTPNNSVLSIETTIGDMTTVSLLNDLSCSDKYKILKSNINVINSQDVAYGQYAYDTAGVQISTIDPNKNFIVNTKLYNNKDDAVTNAYVYTILPYKDDNASSYSGSYSVTLPSDLGSNLQCTSDSVSNIISNAKNATWQDCSTFANNGSYTGLTAYSVHYDLIPGKSGVEAKATISPNGNEADDTYVFKSFVLYDGISTQLAFKDLKVNVLSKKITGIVWEDFNDDGIMGNDEKRVENVTLYLYNTKNELIDTTTPNSNGIYSFSGMTEGEYYVVAEFNTDKYSLTTALTNYSDVSKVSVFTVDSSTVIIPEEKIDEDDELDNELIETDSEDDGEESGIIEPDEDDIPNFVSKSSNIAITVDTRTVSNINLGLSLRKKFEVKLNKYITSAEVTNALGVVTKTTYGNAKLAKLNIRDINNVNIKVVYTIELQNIKYYPGYIRTVVETIPDGMSFNKDYAENAGWVLNDDGTLTNSTLSEELLEEGSKKYLTIALDITRKEAGSFINTASVDDLQILGGTKDEEE